mmetsp:Transcript_8929/g.20441  ORF Transcript_8929/g.20441 Transcript_8929/m.20441 type:complete len:194 (-) Transcript_8929:84-665(-)
MSVPIPSSSSSSGGAPMMAGAATGAGAPDDGRTRPQKSKGLLPAFGIGAAVYLVTAPAMTASLTTLGIVGIGAGVGYGVGKWIANKYQKKQGGAGGQQGVTFDKLPKAVQVALQQWQEFVTRRAAGRELNQEDVAQLWAEFGQIEPTSYGELKKVRMKVGSSVGQGQPACSSVAAASHAPGQPNIVPIVTAGV